MTDYYIELQTIDFNDDNTADPLEYHFKMIQNLDDRGNLPITTIEADIPERNQHMAFQGQARQVPIDWILYDNGEDKSNGTWSDAGIDDSRITSTNDAGEEIIKTPFEQKVYLQWYIFNPNIGADWRLYGGEFTWDWDGDGTDEGTPVAIENSNIRDAAEEANFKRGGLKLHIGQIAG